MKKLMIFAEIIGKETKTQFSDVVKQALQEILEPYASSFEAHCSATFAKLGSVLLDVIVLTKNADLRGSEVSTYAGASFAVLESFPTPSSDFLSRGQENNNIKYVCLSQRRRRQRMWNTQKCSHLYKIKLLILWC